MNDSSSASNKLYDILKFIALVLLPAVGTLYFALAGTWGLPAANEVVASITAVDTFLGVLVQFLANRYNKSDAKYGGAIVVNNTETGRRVYTLDLDTEPDSLQPGGEVTFKIVGPTG